MEFLDSKENIVKLDPKGMYNLTVDFPTQCEKALEIVKHIDFPDRYKGAFNIVMTGLGGSAIGGNLLRSVYEHDSEIPLIVNRDYYLPEFVNEDTLVFVCSYSGNTEETLSAYKIAKHRGSQVIVLTSGGELAEKAKKNRDILIQIPSGQPPRTALGFMFIPLLFASEQLGYIPRQNFHDLFQTLKRCVEDWKVEVPFSENPVKQTAALLKGKLCLLYGLGAWQGVAAERWKGEINENAKNMAFANVLPELNHNEILGWVKADEQGVKNWVTLILEDGKESAKMQTRARVTTELIQEKSAVYRIQARGESLIEKLLSLVFYGDLMSIYLAALNKVDPEDITAINLLKSELSLTLNKVASKDVPSISHLESEPSTDLNEVDPEDISFISHSESEPSTDLNEVDPEDVSFISHSESEPLTDLNEVDPEDIPSISHLKSEL